MKKILLDLIKHQEWADAVHWKLLSGNPALLEDEELKIRLRHLHFGQYAFMCVITGKNFDLADHKKMPDIYGLEDYAKTNDKTLVEFVVKADENSLQELINLPWFKDPPLSLTKGETIMNITMHSHYHRGQNARKFRLLDIEPPLTDIAVWHWKGRPEADW